MNRKVRAAVVLRSQGFCEACFRFCGDEGHLDHAFGRAKAEETVENCWYLCGPSTDRPGCDDDKTNNRPSARVWLERFGLHASLHGYADAAKRAQDKLAVQALKFGAKP